MNKVEFCLKVDVLLVRPGTYWVIFVYMCERASVNDYVQMDSFALNTVLNDLLINVEYFPFLLRSSEQ